MVEDMFRSVYLDDEGKKTRMFYHVFYSYLYHPKYSDYF